MGGKRKKKIKSAQKKSCLDKFFMLRRESKSLEINIAVPQK